MIANTNGLEKPIISNEKTRLARRSKSLIFLFLLLCILSIACLFTVSQTMTINKSTSSTSYSPGPLSSQLSSRGSVDIGYYSFRLH
jgi:hypothetical protein